MTLIELQEKLGQQIDGYIERKAAIRCVENQCVDGKMWGNEETEGTLVDAYELMDDLSDIPAADAVVVTRCKDCEYWQDNNGGYPNKECRWREDETPDADDFCSCGERKDGDDNAVD